MNLIPTCEHGYKLEGTAMTAYSCPVCSKPKTYYDPDSVISYLMAENAALKQRLAELEAELIAARNFPIFDEYEKQKQRIAELERKLSDQVYEAEMWERAAKARIQERLCPVRRAGKSITARDCISSGDCGCDELNLLAPGEGER